jgi:hypothetical protein
MAQKISVLVNENNEIPVLLQDLKSEGVRISDVEVVHKRPETLRDLFRDKTDTPRINDYGKRQILRSMSISDDDRHFSEARLDRGATLLIFEVADNLVERVSAVLRRHQIAVPTEVQTTKGQVLRKGDVIGTGYPSGLTKIEKIDSICLRAREFDPTGWKVLDPDNEKIGDIKYLLGSPTTGQPMLAVVDCGGLFKDKLVVVPFERLRFDINDKAAEVPFHKEQIKKAPNFTEKDLDYGRFSTYWDQVTQEEYAYSER